MYLKPKQAKTVYKLLFALLEYTNIQYELDEVPLTAGPGGVSPEETRPILEFLWEHSEKIIDDFMLKNPFDFSLRELETIQGWKHHISGHFYPIENTKRGTVMVLDDEAFEVIGISNDIAEMIPAGRHVVETTLLPFEGEIIYDTIITRHNIVLGPNMSKTMIDTYDQLKADDAVIKDAKGLVLAAGRIKDREARRKQEENNSVLEKKQAPATTHEGVLAGLSDEERETVVAERLQDALDEINKLRHEFIAACTHRREPTADMDVCLNLMRKDNLVEYARDVGIKYAAKKRKADLAAELGKALSTPGGVGIMLRAFNQRALDFLEAIIANGGMLTITIDEVDRQAPPLILEPLIFTFLTGAPFSFGGEVLTYILPEGVADAFRELKETEYFTFRREWHEIDEYAIAMTELYGVISLDEFLEVYNEQHEEAEQLEKDQMLDKLITLTGLDEKNYELWFFEGDDYLAYYELVAIDTDEEDEEDNDPLGFAKYVAKRHHTIPMKKLPREELLGYSYLTFVEKTQEYKRLRRFFDANIPNGLEIDEVFFAENILDDLYDYFMWENDFGEAMDYLNECGLDFDIDKTNILLSLIADASNNAPKWSNFGWTPHELLERQGGWKKGQTLSKAPDEGDGDPDFEAQEPYHREEPKIGRNSLCPCGSGKKYKNCCGRVPN